MGDYYKVEWNGEKWTAEEKKGCFIPMWLIIVIAIMAATVVGSKPEGELQVGGLVCYESIIWGDYCE